MPWFYSDFMDSLKRTDAVFEKAKKLALVNFATGDGMPTRGMVNDAISDAESDAAQTDDELAMYVRRLVRLVRKQDPENPVAASAVEFLKCTGHAKIFSR